nr:phage tail length tape measure family protein [Paracoccus amoyensis]
MYTGNVAAQGFDIGVTAAMGMNPAIIGLQQGTQLAQVAQQMGGGMTAVKGMAQGFMALISPMTLATIGLTTFAAFGIQGLMKLRGETKSFDEAMSELADSIESYERNIGRSRSSTAEMSREFGLAADEVRALLTEMSALDKRTAERNARETMSSLTGDLDLLLPDLSLRSDRPGNDPKGTAFHEQRMEDRFSLSKLFDMDETEKNLALFDDVLDRLTQLSRPRVLTTRYPPCTGWRVHGVVPRMLKKAFQRKKTRS